MELRKTKRNMAMIKTEREIAYIRKAVKITDEIYAEFKPQVVAGKTELELHTKLLKMIDASEADTFSFNPIIAAGPGAAEPHHEPTDYVIKEGDMVLVDMGVFYKGLSSDMTRMIAIGEPEDELLEIYDITREALEEAVLEIAAGVKASHIDIIARDLIQWNGYGDKFIHTTGHGLGHEVHEAPMIYASSKEVLEAGMVITVEPGIYLEGKYGVRLENDILVTPSGYEILNSTDLDY